jgi:WD40 repeat protein
LKLSWSEEYLAIGGVDGLIELYNTRDYSLYDNEYQREGQMFFHDYPIHCMEFNYTDEMLASADTKGIVNVWNLQNGKLLRKIDKETALNAICWGVDPSHLVLAYK